MPNPAASRRTNRGVLCIPAARALLEYVRFLDDTSPRGVHPGMVVELIEKAVAEAALLVPPRGVCIIPRLPDADFPLLEFLDRLWPRTAR